MGRFMSPDPLMATPERLFDPQQWNMYAYAKNNPLRFTDPTGKYVCGASKENCTGIETARQNALKSDDSSVRAAAKAYGDPGKDNKVYVGVGDTPKGAGGAVTFGKDANGKANGTINVTFSQEQVDAAKGGALGQVALDANVSHEGQHVKDDQKLINSGYNPKFDITHRETEVRAYGVEERVIETEANRANPAWSSPGAINDFINTHPNLYPNPSAPILAPSAVPQPQ